MSCAARVFCFLLLLLVQTNCKLNCDLSPWAAETLHCFPIGNKGNHIVKKGKQSNYVEKTVTDDFKKYNWRRITTFILKDSKLYSLSPDLFVDASELINLDLSGNPDLCFKGGEFVHLKKLQTLRLSGSSQCTESSLLSSVTNLRALDLSNLRISSSIFSMRNLSSFTRLEHVDLSRNVHIDFTTFKFGGAVTYLDASQTIVTLGNACLENAVHLQTLLLSQSGILDIPKRAFTGTAINHLDLSYNSLQFKSLFSLTETLIFLNLSHNNLGDFFRSGIFQQQLETLDLSFNNISSLHVDTFENTEKLIFLNLANNNLSWLYEKVFLGLTQLKTLNLSYNKLAHFHVNIFIDLQNMETLNLAGNVFHTLDFALFQQIARIKHLYLQENHLQTLNILLFANLKELSTLDLRNNKLLRLPEGLLKVGNLKTLAISCNKLSFIPPNFFIGQYGTRVFLQGNPWKCGCLFPVLNTLKNVEVIQTDFTDGSHPTCFVGEGNHSECNDNTLSDNDYLRWQLAVKENDITC